MNLTGAWRNKTQTGWVVWSPHIPLACGAVEHGALKNHPCRVKFSAAPALFPVPVRDFANRLRVAPAFVGEVMGWNTLAQSGCPSAGILFAATHHEHVITAPARQTEWHITQTIRSRAGQFPTAPAILSNCPTLAEASPFQS